MAAKKLARGTVVKMPGGRKGIVLGAKPDKQLYVCTISKPKFGGRSGRQNLPLMTGVSLRSGMELRAVGKIKKMPWQCLSHFRDFKRFAKRVGG